MRQLLSDWTWRRGALGVAAVAIAVGGGFDVSALTGSATAAPAPLKLAAAWADNEEQGQKVWLGIVIVPLNADIATKLGIGQSTGVAIMEVMKDGPAAKAGVLRADVLLKVNSDAVTDMATARAAIAKAKPADTVVLTVSRGGQEQTVSVVAGERSAPPIMKPRPPMPPMAGMIPGLPKMKELEGIAPADMFAHMQGGTMTFTDKDGKPVTVTATLGKVTAVNTAASAPSVTVQPNAGGSPVTYTVGADTQIHGRARALVQLKMDDKVTVITVNGSSEARAIMSALEVRQAPVRPARPGRGGAEGPKAGAMFEVAPFWEGMGGMGGNAQYTWSGPDMGRAHVEVFAIERAAAN